ncbi:MAG: TIGR03857 family LLM class F420-dependent oxidoreductase [Proteobacteria bacterium]|nr:MAG: TIGR03857 family LLM class F420-dependent oxidoreductase [Pseudomonadota bacterium]
MGQLHELGFYTLAGAPKSPREAIDEVRDAEALGLGSAFVSERWNVKEACALSGAVGAVSTRLGIATAATNHNTRHPAVTASFATTMHRLTGGRFALGLGRGIDVLFRAFGIPRITNAQVEDFVGLLRRLWRGETVLGHDGPAGKWPVLRLDPDFREDIPLLWTAFGPNSLALGGRLFDAVVLHTFFSDETLVRCVRAVKRAAEEAGRDPASVRVWSCYATVGDHLPEPLRLKKTVGRLATYLHGYGDLLVRTNGWDPKALERFRADPFVAGFRGAFDQVATTEELERVAALLPREWLASAATGSPEQCARRVLGQLELGADAVILHGATPAELAPVIAAYRALRPVGRFERYPANPGGRLLVI